MKWLFIGLALASVAFIFGMGSRGPEKLETVDQLDVDRYLGRWYAVASIVKPFNRSCVWGNSAQYSARDDGRIDVLNTCYTENGQKRETRAVAWVPDQAEPGRLKVSFVPLFGYKLFLADYWVLELGSEYEYAVVGHPSRSFGWILSRSPQLPSEQLDSIAASLERKGYDFSEFRLNPQRPPTSSDT